VSYRELAPPPDLAHLVLCLWERAGTGEETVVMPDGCVDVVVRDGVAHVAGPDTRPDPVTIAAGVAVTGIRFRPGAGAAVLGVAADELRDARTPLDAVWGGAVAEEVGARGAADAAGLAAALERWLRAAAPDPRVLAAVGRLARAPGSALPEVADAVGLGERQLRRRFTEAVGYGPKTFARVARFRRALALLGRGAAPAAVAYDAGYADQAHLTRELRSLAGRTPAALRNGAAGAPRPTQ
jgi:AraC-like DNA-binding protein